MIEPRLIPSLLIHNKGIVKTEKFDINKSKYIGDPLNTVKLFNEKKVDELCIFDIDSKQKDHSINYDLIAKITAECTMPLCYGGGINSIEQIEKLIALGVEKVSISSAAIKNPELISEAANRVGSQSIVTTLDVKKTNPFGKYMVHTHNGKKNSGISPAKLAKEMETRGAGEIIINTIDRDGMMKGYDFELVKLIRDSHNLPMSILGGASSLENILNLWTEYGLIGAAVGSLFIFKGKYKAVLVNYPTSLKKQIYS